MIRSRGGSADDRMFTPEIMELNSIEFWIFEVIYNFRSNWHITMCRVASLLSIRYFIDWFHRECEWTWLICRVYAIHSQIGITVYFYLLMVAWDAEGEEEEKYFQFIQSSISHRKCCVSLKWPHLTWSKKRKDKSRKEWKTKWDKYETSNQNPKPIQPKFQWTNCLQSHTHTLFVFNTKEKIH